MALTDIEVKAKTHKDKKTGEFKVAPYKLSDGKGLYMMVSKAGSKYWRLKYRFDGKEKVLALGVYPDVSLAKAREKAIAARGLLDEGVDPAQQRKDEKAESEAIKKSTFKVWAEKWWQHWHVDKSPRHADYVKRRLETDIFPAIGDLPITTIEAHQVTDAVKAIAGRGALDLAKRAHQTMGQVFRYAIAHSNESKVKRNPATDIKPSDIIPSRNKQNYARVDLKEMPALLRTIDASTAHPITRIAVKLLSLTFVRTRELLGARWEEFDLENKQWRIPAERMKMKTDHIVPLPKQALLLLDDLKPHTGHYELLFPNQNSVNKPMSNNTILKALERMGYKGVMTGHGFRGVASTALHEHGFNHDHIELQLAHQQRNQVSAAYNHALYLQPRTEMMQWWADHLDKLKAGAEIVPFKQA